MTDKRLYKEIATAIKQQLSDGVYKVGDKLPTERTLSETFGVGRAVIREAMILLEAEGFIDIRKSSGVYVLKTKPSLIPFSTARPVRSSCCRLGSLSKPASPPSPPLR